MKNFSLLFVLLSLYGFSCNSALRNVFGTQTPHEVYADKLDDKGLDKTPEGRAWLAASKAALETSVQVSLPYRQQGVFHEDKPRALGLKFSAKQGEKLNFSVTKKTGVALPLYADLFEEGGQSPLFSADTSTTEFSFAVEKAGIYILRLQPKLANAGEYSLSVSVGPSISFPVSGGKASVGSVWGDVRDGGKRSHEGIDIFAPKLTSAVAAVDGYITGVREGGIGGKVVWLRAEGKAYTLYYAHLDKQLVQEGQQVKKGDVVGLVGNTGNAKYTPSHLHFGVYTYSGPVDPLPFVSRTIKSAPSIVTKKLSTQLKLKKAHKLENGVMVKAATYLVPLAANAKGYLAEDPNGSLLQVPYSAVLVTKDAIEKPQGVAITKAKLEVQKS